MSKFCMYEAIGYRYPVDKDGNKIPSKKASTGKFRGCVEYGVDMYGSILRQNPELLHCDAVDFDTWGI